MARNGSGSYSPPGASFPAVDGTIIEAAKYNSVINDIGSEITNSIAVDGQSVITADIPMNNKKLTGLAAGSAPGHSARYDELILRALKTGDTFTGLVSLASASSIASATTLDLTAATGNTVVITGTTTTTAITINAGQQFVLIAAAAWPLTYHATNLNINGSASYTCAAGDRLEVFKDSTGVVRVNVTKQNGQAVVGPDTSAYALLASPAFTGNPTAPTASAADNDTSIATTAFVCSSGWVESAEQTITTNSLLSVTHGLGRIPKDVQLLLRCKTADRNYSVNDEVVPAFGVNSTASYYVPAPVGANATLVFSRVGFFIAVFDYSTGSFVDITNSSWRLFFRYR